MKKLSQYIAPILFSTTVATTTYAVDKSPLTLKVYNADGSSFHVNSTLVYGDTEAMVIDAGFTRADAFRIAANVLDSGKTLTTIFISQADPDYYFGAETLKQFFPGVKIITTPAVRKRIETKMKGKVAFWAPKMGGNAPITPILPKAYNDTSLMVDGYKVEIKGTSGLLAHRPYIWIPYKKALVGNIAIFGNLHVWTADTKTTEELDAWKAQLVEIKNLSPDIVVPGHMNSGTRLEVDSINYTLSYLSKFGKALETSQNASEVIKTMKQTYSEQKLSIALDIGAKVHKGEMKW